MLRALGEVVLWPGRGVYRVLSQSSAQGQTCVNLCGMEGQGDAQDVPVWKLRSIPRPLDWYPRIPQEKK